MTTKPVSPTNKTDLHYITEILLKVALNTKTRSFQIHLEKSFFNLFFIRILNVSCNTILNILVVKLNTVKPVLRDYLWDKEKEAL
jgi:hypothetical protein